MSFSVSKLEKERQYLHKNEKKAKYVFKNQQKKET